MRGDLLIPDEWADLLEDEPISSLVRVAPGFYSARAPQGWPQFCKWASACLPGQWVPKGKGATWCKGSRTAWIVEPEEVSAILDARRIPLGLGLECGYSLGSVARALLKWVGPGQYPYRDALRLLDNDRHNCLRAVPIREGEGTQYDVSAYYYTLLRRLPTWRPVLLGGGRVEFGREAPGVEDRRHELLELVAGEKLVRNALVGAALGATGWGVMYVGGQRVGRPPQPGRFRAAAALVIRTGWELTRLADEETSSVLTYIDCVTPRWGEYPETWARYGLVVKEAASGPLEVYNCQTFRVGPKASYWYREGSRLVDPTEPAPLPSTLVHRAWLTPAA